MADEQIDRRSRLPVVSPIRELATQSSSVRPFRDRGVGAIIGAKVIGRGKADGGDGNDDASIDPCAPARSNGSAEGTGRTRGETVHAVTARSCHATVRLGAGKQGGGQIHPAGGWRGGPDRRRDSEDRDRRNGKKRGRCLAGPSFRGRRNVMGLIVGAHRLMAI